MCPTFFFVKYMFEWATKGKIVAIRSHEDFAIIFNNYTTS